jgi:hypothetical protein
VLVAELCIVTKEATDWMKTSVHAEYHTLFLGVGVLPGGFNAWGSESTIFKVGHHSTGTCTGQYIRIRLIRCLGRPSTMRRRPGELIESEVPLEGILNYQVRTHSNIQKVSDVPHELLRQILAHNSAS